MIELRLRRHKFEGEPTPHRSISPQHFQGIIQQKIDSVLMQINSYERFGALTNELHEVPLLHIDGNHRNEAYVENLDGVIIGYMDPKLMARYAVTTMTKVFGLDENIFCRSDKFKDQETDESGVDSVVFPSQTFPGLSFCRVRFYDRKDPEFTHQLYWFAQDHASPLRVDGKDILPGKSFGLDHDAHPGHA